MPGPPRPLAPVGVLRTSCGLFADCAGPDIPLHMRGRRRHRPVEIDKPNVAGARPRRKCLTT